MHQHRPIGHGEGGGQHGFDVVLRLHVEGWLLSETRLTPGGPDGFVIGYSGHEATALREAARRLGEAVREAS